MEYDREWGARDGMCDWWFGTSAEMLHCVDVILKHVIYFTLLSSIKGRAHTFSSLSQNRSSGPWMYRERDLVCRKSVQPGHEEIPFSFDSIVGDGEQV